MQGILISLATAVILAIGGAFVAPFVVDWNDWRGSFESEIGRALGIPVVIRGNIDADILPAPRVVLRDVTLGDVVSTGGTVRELKAELSLGALFRGEVEATGVSLVNPRMRLVLDSSGRVALPTGLSGGTELAIARITVEDGSLDILDRASDHTLTLSDLDLRGEARSRSGPFRLDGEAEAYGARFGVRASLGKIADDGAGRLRLQLDGRTRPYDLDIDGSLGLAGAAPRFDGKASLIRKGGEGFAAWQLSAGLTASAAAVVADNLELSLGGAAIPAQLSGSARLTLGRAIGLDAVLNARSLDLDALRAASQPAAPGAEPAQARPGAALSSFLALFAELPAPDIASKIGLSAEQLMLGGTLVRDARADISGTRTGWRIDMAEAQLPGKATLRVSGLPVRTPQGDGFDGDAVFSAEDPAAFLRWAAPDAVRDVGAAVRGPVRIAAKVGLRPGEVKLDDLDATFAASRLRGAILAALDPAAGPRLDLRLAMDGFDLDPIAAALQRAAAAVGGGADAALRLDGQNLTLAGLPLRALALDATATGGSWRVRRVVLDDLAGMRLDGAGWMENFSTTPRGEFNLALSGDRAEGLVPMMRLAAGDETAQTLTPVLARLVPVAAPVKLSSTVVWSEAGGRTITGSGSLGQIAGNITFARSTAGAPMRVDLAAETTQAERVLAALGIDGLSPRLGAGRFTLAVDPLLQGDASVRGRLSLAGLDVSGEGTARLAGDTLSPRLAMRADGADLGRLLPQVAAANANQPVPAALAFTLARAGNGWRLDGIDGSLGGAPLSGHLDFEPGAVPRLGGALRFDTLSLPRILGIFGARLAGEPGAGTAFFVPARFVPNAVSGIALGLDLAAGRLAVLGPYAATDGRLRLASDGIDLDLRDLSGAFGGGRMAANLQVRRRNEGVQADGRLVLDKVAIAALTAPSGARTPPEGHVSLALDLSGSGRTLQALAQSLAGQGSIAVTDLRIEGADPGALEAVLAETASLPAPPDERRTALLLDRALARGPVLIPRVESTIGVVGGLMRLSPARTNVGMVRVGLGGSFDIPRLQIDATMDLEGPDTAGGVPAGSISWRGPVTAPERRTGAAALTSIIAMRAIERETRRLEERQRAGRPDEALPAASRSLPAVPAAPAAATTLPPRQDSAPQEPARIIPPAQPAATAPAAPPPAPAATAPAAASPAVTNPATTAPAPAAASPAATIPAAAAPAATVPARASSPSAPAATAPAWAPDTIERQDASAPAASGGSGRFGAGTATTAPAPDTRVVPEARTAPDTRTAPAPREAPSTERSSESSTVRRPPRVQQAPARQVERERAPQEAPARSYSQEPTLPPTRGFGDLPRPPGLVGE